MEFHSKYVAKHPDAKGYIDFSPEENAVWGDLYRRQIRIVENYACDEFLEGLKILNLNCNAIPQISEINNALKKVTGWSVAPVAALISHQKFFQLLANKQFPAATFIRSREEFNYVTEPDLFHEYFGHCPMLTVQTYADFMCAYAQFVLNLPEKEWPLLQRLYWFTVEFGLIQTPKGLRAYGGGILSSPTETVYCVDSNIPDRLPLGDCLDALRTPYRIDELQKTYFIIQKYEELYHLFNEGEANTNPQALLSTLKKAHQLGEYPPKFVADDRSPSACVHINCC